MCRTPDLFTTVEKSLFRRRREKKEKKIIALPLLWA